jgi:hypothetical protein
MSAAEKDADMYPALQNRLTTWKGEFRHKWLIFPGSDVARLAEKLIGFSGSDYVLKQAGATKERVQESRAQDRKENGKCLIGKGRTWDLSMQI